MALAAVLSIVSFEASAIVRYLVQDMTCAEVRQALDRDGVAIFYRKSTSSGVPLYDRYVKDDTFCGSGETISRSSVPVADTGDCRVSKCVNVSRFGD